MRTILTATIMIMLAFCFSFGQDSPQTVIIHASFGALLAETSADPESTEIFLIQEEIEEELIFVLPDGNYQSQIVTLMSPQVPGYYPMCFEATRPDGSRIEEYCRTKIVMVVDTTQCFLSHNFPEPFLESTEFTFWIPQDQHVTVTLFTVLGQRLTILVDENLERGMHSVLVDMPELLASPLADALSCGTGIYFYRMETQGYSETRKMVYTP